MKALFLILGFLLLFAAEILRVYFIMPFPGSQKADTIDTAYWLARNILWIRIVAILMIAYPGWQLLKQQGKIGKKIFFFLFIIVYGVVFVMVNFKMEADVMFYQPTNKIFAQGNTNKVAAEKLVIGVSINGQAKAYPIQFIGYHHQVTDTVGGEPVMVTYCTVCRTGRVFSPVVNGKHETFRLVGMDHFNAMFEDATTKTWWRQVSGEAIAGPLKGTSLQEIPSEQMALSAWQRKYPATFVMQPDSLYKEIYDKMTVYEQGRSKSDLTKRDSLSWKDKSWVIGVVHGNTSKAYDWNQLVQQRLIQDSLPGLPLLIVLEKDSISFHIYNRTIDGTALQFSVSDPLQLKDANTGSYWNIDGLCTAGPLSGKRLVVIRGYQEYWHSWRTFHPLTLK